MTRYPRLNRLRQIMNHSKKEETKLETVSFDQHDQVKRQLAKATAKNAALSKVNTALAEENEKLIQKLNTLESDRKHVIEVLHQGINFSDLDREASVQSFTKSGMSFEDIATHLEQVRRVKGVRMGTSNRETKLPQRSDSDFIY